MSTQHTPGPWRFNKDGRTVDGGELHPLESIMVATIHGWGPDYEANGRLISAAPDLMAALMEFRDYFNEWGTPVPGTRTAAVFEQARAAIAKATGEVHL